MDCLVVRGSKPLKGQVRISGSKNSTLPIMAASLLCCGEVVLTGVPDLEDIKVMAQALEVLGAKVKREKDVLIIDGSTVNRVELPEEISRKMRASNLVMGALLSRFHQARVAYPGGCAIGTRPMDLHLKGFQSMGFNIREEYGYMEGTAGSLRGQEILLDFPSVGATENLIMAATLLPGTTVLRNAAREPEIVDLQNF